MITVTGWTWEYIDEEMTLPRLYAMSQYWRDHPPLHLLVAAFMGVKPATKQTKEEKEATIDQMVADFAIAGLTMN